VTRSARTARAPGRVNLIGDHTDYTGGMVLPMAIDRETVVRVEPSDEPVVRLRSLDEPGEAVVPLAVVDPERLTPTWARYVAGVVAEVRPSHGVTGTVRSTVPVGAGLSSSAALEVAVALALGAPGDDPVALAEQCRRAEHRAVGVPSGIMDQLASAAGVAGAALMIDCHTRRVTPAPLPPADEVEVVVVHSGQARTLAGSAYAERVAQCAAAEARIGPLRTAGLDDVTRLADPVVRARARHVVTENDRVRAFAAAMAAGDLVTAGRVMDASHASLATDYAVSTDVLDALCARLRATAGVFGARLTGAGFGGCVVALCRPGALGSLGWSVRAVAGASVRTDGPATTPSVRTDGAGE
jgi:galactokinase